MPEVRTCDFHEEHDELGEPLGEACGAPATHRIQWWDGRYSYGCAEHLIFDVEKPLGVQELAA